MKKILLNIIFILLLTNLIFSLEINAKSPLDNAKNVDIRNIFRWEVSDEGDYKFNLYLSTDENIQKDDMIISNLFSNFYAGNILKPNSHYYWQIEAIEGNESIKSEIFYFETRPLEDGDIYEIIYGDYTQIEIYNDLFLGIKSKKVDILSKEKRVTKSFELKNEFKKITFFNEKAFILDDQGNLYLLEDQTLEEKGLSYDFIDISNNIAQTKNRLLYYDGVSFQPFLEDGNIIRIKSIGEKLFVFYQDKITKYSSDLNLEMEIEEKDVIDVFEFENGYLLLKNKKIVHYTEDLEKINEIDFNIEYIKMNRKINTSNGFVFILSGQNILSIYNKNLEMIKSINLDFKTDYVIADKENFILIGESIKSQNINGDTFWTYGTLNQMEIFSKPIIKGDSFLIGVSDYLKRHLFFYNDFSEYIDKKYKTNKTYFEQVEPEIEPEEQELTEEATQTATPLETEEELTEQATEIIKPTEEATSTIEEIEEETITSPATEIEQPTVTATVNEVEETELSTITTEPQDLFELMEESTEITDPSTLLENVELTPESTITEEATDIDFEITAPATIVEQLESETPESTTTQKATQTTEEPTQTTEEATYTFENIENLNFDFYYEYADFIDEMYNSLVNGVTDVFDQEPVEIEKVYENDNDIYLYDINIDKNATETSIYLTGYENNGEWNNLVYKLDEKLELKRQSIFGGNKTDFLKKSLITKDASDNTVIISVGDTTSEGLNGDISLVSLDATLNQNYVMNYGDLGRDSGINIKDYDGENFIIMGNLYQNNKLTDMFLSKYTNNGARLWTSAFGGKSIEIASDFSVDNQENILALGSTRSFGYGGFDIYIVKTDFYGNEIWSNTFGTSENDLPVGIQSLSGNKFLIFYQAEKEDNFENRLMVLNSDGNIVKQFSNETEGYEKLLGMEEYKNNFYAYGFKRTEDKTTGIIYKVDIENNTLNKIFEIEREDNYEIRAIDFHDDLIYIAGNEFDEEKNRILILRKELKGDK
jgi:hypothetical protein